VRVDDLYQGDLLKGEYRTKKVYAWFQKRHSKALAFIDEEGYYRRNGHEWKVPYGVRYCLHQPLLPGQVAVKYPFMVTWRSKDGERRLFKRMASLPHAIIFVAEKAQYADSRACILNRLHMDIPPAYRNKIPPPYKWCPRCMKPRKFGRLYHRSGKPQVFYARIKRWNKKKGYWEYPERKLSLMACTVCGCTNRDDKFRRSNQPFHTTVVKRRRRAQSRR
jgi:hypothetical protein